VRLLKFARNLDGWHIGEVCSCRSLARATARLRLANLVTNNMRRLVWL